MDFSRPFDYDNATEEERAEFRKWAWENSELDEEEQWYEDHFDEFVPCENQEEMHRKLTEAAKRPPIIHYADGTTSLTRKSKKPITLRVDIGDLNKIKTIAAEKGLQYQTLVGSILHRYAAGTLVDIAEAKKVLSNG